jgi:non-specific serine/threonine protein kinase
MLAGTIWRFWWTRGAVDESAHWYERAFAVGGNASPLARARAKFGAAHVTESRGDNERARKEFAESAELLCELRETRWAILALTHVATADRRLGERERGDSVNQRALELALSTADVRGAAVVKSNMGFFLLTEGESDRATVLFEEALEASRLARDDLLIASCLANLCLIAFHAGNLERAGATLRESLKLYAVGNARELLATLATGIDVVFALGDADTAARVCSAITTLCRQHGFRLDPTEQEGVDRTVDAARRDLGPAFEEAWRAGADLELEGAVKLALGALD